MATDVYFTTNPSDFNQLEGLYISERNPPGFISGVDLSALGIAGETIRGPLDVTEITSVSRFVEVYGGRDYGAGGALVNKIWKALLNKPVGKLYIKRVVDTASAVAGSLSLTTSAATGIIDVTATSVGAWSLAANNGPVVSCLASSDGDTNHFNLAVTYLGERTLYKDLDASGTKTTEDLNAQIGDDIANVISITLAANGVPEYNTSGNLTGGADGTVASSHYTAAITDLANAEGPRIVMAAESSFQSNVTGQMVTEAASASDRVFVTWAGTHGQDASTEAAQVTTDVTTRSDRIIWTVNGPYTVDPETGNQIQSAPDAWMCSILTQNDVDIDPGALQTVAQTAGVKKLTTATWSRADLITLKDAGACVLEKLPEGFVFRSAVTTSLESGKEYITRRRSADFLQLSAAGRLRTYVKRKNTVTARANMVAELTAFSRQLQRSERIIESFGIKQQSVNSNNQRAQGIEKLLWRVRLIGHMRFLVLETEIGTGIVIEA